MFKDKRFAFVETLSKELLPDAQNNNLQIKTYNYGSVWYLQFNCSKPLTGNKNFRKAIQVAINRQEFCDQIVGIPGTRPAIGIVPEYMPGVETTYGEEYRHDFKDADLDRARAYLAQAKIELGMETIPPIRVLLSDADTAKRDMEYMQGYLNRTLGIELVLDPQTFKVRLERTDNGDFDIVNSGWGPDYMDAMTFADLHTSWNEQNDTRWASEAYDRHIETAMTSLDQKVRLDAIFAAEKILIEDAPIVPYFQAYRAYVQDPRLQGLLRRTISPDPDFYYARIVDVP
jgi:oligopeptide transport system substrate-binding protein